MKKNIIKNILVITITFVIIFAIILLLSRILLVHKNNSVKYFNLNDDRVPSMYLVTKEKKLCKYRYYKKNNNEIIYLKYKNITNSKNDISNYIDVLKNKYNYIYTSDINLDKNNGELELSTSSYDPNKIIIINIVYTNHSYEMTITKGKGTINILK